MLIVEYYRDTGRQKIERRRALADRLGISMNALAIRASRIRDALVDVPGGVPERPTKELSASLSYQDESTVIRARHVPATRRRPRPRPR